MRARGAGDWFPAGSRAAPLWGVGQSPTSAANGASKTRQDPRRGWANTRNLPIRIRPTPWQIRARSALYSPNPVANPSAFRSVFARPRRKSQLVPLVRLRPTPHKGSALDPAGNQSPAPHARIRSLVTLRFFFFFFFYSSNSALSLMILTCSTRLGVASETEMR